MSRKRLRNEKRFGERKLGAASAPWTIRADGAATATLLQRRPASRSRGGSHMSCSGCGWRAQLELEGGRLTSPRRSVACVLRAALQASQVWMLREAATLLRAVGGNVTEAAEMESAASELQGGPPLTVLTFPGHWPHVTTPRESRILLR